MKRILTVLLCAGMLMSLLAGCNPEDTAYVPTGDALEDENAPTATVKPPETEESAMSLVYYPARTLNPFQAMDYTNRVLFGLIYQGLFAVSSEYKAAPVLCQSYRMSADMKTYTFTLANAYFSDGAALTAEDVVASLTAAQQSPYFGNRLQHVSSITAQAGAVEIALKVPMENLPILLDIPIVKASEVAASNPLGTGPFLLDNSPQGKWLRRQPGWWCDAQLPVTVDFITLVAAESPSQIRDGFEFLDISLVCSDPGRIDYVDFRRDHELWDCENGQFLYLVCNEKSELFADPAVRAALTHAIDRDALVNRYYRGFAKSATLPASPDSPYYNHTLSRKFGYDPQKFIDAVAAAKVESKEVTLLLCGDDQMRVRLGNAIAEMLEAGGLQVTINQVTTAKFDETLRWGKYDLYLGQTKLSANMDLSAFFASNGSLKYGGLADPAMQAMCLEALANTGNYYNLHKMVAEEGQLVPLLFQHYAVYTRRGVLYDLQPARDNIFYYDLGRTLEDAKIAE